MMRIGCNIEDSLNTNKKPRCESTSVLILQQRNVVFLTDFQSVIIPQAGLHFANVGAANEQHTKTALSNATADGQGQLAV